MALRDGRADKGLIRCTPRDERALGFLAQMRCAWEPDLRLVLREPGGPPLSARAVQATVDRWRRARWVRAEKTWTRHPRMVSLLPAGYGLVGDQPVYKPLGEGLRQHHAAVSRCRLWLEGSKITNYGRLVSWRSEREIRQASYAPPPVGSTSGHVPDGVATFEHVGEVAIEVELSPKEAGRLDPIVEELATLYAATWYLGLSSARVAVAASVARLVEAGRIPPGRVWVYPLPDDPAVIA